jgi:hypothetical protein
MTGRRLSEETKQKIRESRLGKKMNEHCKMLLSERMKALTLEERIRRSKLANETKKKKGIFPGIFQNGHKHSDAVREKFRKIMTGKRGELSAAWKGGITPHNKLARTGLEFKRWRTEVFIRDGYKCKKCNTNGYLHPHHIYNFSEHKDKRYCPDNGMTLCIGCHKEFHNKYGRKKNNQAQLNEWMDNNE